MEGAWEDSYLMTDDTRYYEFSSFMHRESESNGGSFLMAKKFINHDRTVRSCFPARNKILQEVCVI
jgi:hypothetical protein